MVVVHVWSPSTVSTANGSGRLKISRFTSPWAPSTLDLAHQAAEIARIGRDLPVTLIERSESLILKVIALEAWRDAITEDKPAGACHGEEY